jgi:hypothetical protein
MTGDIAEIMKKNGSRRGEAHQERLAVGPHREVPCPASPLGEQHLPGGLVGLP